MTHRQLGDSPWADARWLVLAPHPDDETLGAGALIADAAARDRLAAIAYLTDGTGSHPAGTRGLAARRRSEAAIALHRLAGRRLPVAWIGWPDAHPFELGQNRFDRDAGLLAALLRRLAVDAIAVTAANEPHCDHVAAYRLAVAAIRLARRRIALFGYHVWSRPSSTAQGYCTRAMAPGRRRHALHAHRSQLTTVIGPGFRLTREQQRMAARDILYRQERSA